MGIHSSHETDGETEAAGLVSKIGALFVMDYHGRLQDSRLGKLIYLTWIHYRWGPNIRDVLKP